MLDVYLKNTWCLLVDKPSKVIVTVYRIDLGCGEDFNIQYINKMMEKLNESEDKLLSINIEVEAESAMYREMIAQSKSQINEYKSMIKQMEELCNGYQTIIDNNIVKVSQANREVAEIINTLISKREF